MSHTPPVRGIDQHFFYESDLAVLRDARPATGSDLLGEDGGHLGAILGRLGSWERERVSAYAVAITPRLVVVGASTPGGDYVAARMRLATGPVGEERHFGAESMSERTIRAVGLLTALFQPGARGWAHPTSRGGQSGASDAPDGCGGAVRRANQGKRLDSGPRRQPERRAVRPQDTDLSAILVASVPNGVTSIDRMDPVSRSIASDGLATVADLLRSDQLTPSIPTRLDVTQ